VQRLLRSSLLLCRSRRPATILLVVEMLTGKFEFVTKTAASCRRRAALAGLVGLNLALGAGHAAGNPVKSRYTTIDLETCQVLKRHADGNTWQCSGLRGYPITYSAGDLRAFVSFGANGTTRRAAQQTLAPFNTIFDGRRRRATVEWRFRRIGATDVPYATIMRVFTSLDRATGEVLVVTKVTDTEACHMAYIDARANPDAMALARSAADELAPKWSCASEPKVIGAQGKSPL
jgi:hypothetical protein